MNAKDGNRSLPYSRQWIDEDDIEAVCEVLRSDRLTTGPKVRELEAAVEKYTGAQHAVAVNSGTAALHSAMYALNIGPGDEVIVPTLTFAATANVAVYQGATPVFADVDPGTLLIDDADVARKVTSRTRAVIAVDYAGQPCDYQALRAICDQHDLALVADACHALGGADGQQRVGAIADLTAFSLHPVKPITAGEGGLLTTNSGPLAARARRFRNHGIDHDAASRQRSETWYYEMLDVGFNYRLTDIQCALATSQLKKLDAWTTHRSEIAEYYAELLDSLPMIQPLQQRPNTTHAYHLYVVRVAGDGRICRQFVFDQLRLRGIGVQVHYIPVHLHPFYQKNYKTTVGLCPAAEQAYTQILSLPLFPRMTKADATYVVQNLQDIVSVQSSTHAA